MTSTILPFIIAFFGVAVVGVIAGLLYYAFKPANKEIDYAEQLKEIVEDEDDLLEKDNIILKWNKYWSRLLADSNIDRYHNSSEYAGRDVAIASLLLLLVTTLFTGNILLGLIAPVTGMYAFTMFIKTSGQRKTKAIDEQLPGLLFSLKSNLQAGETSERALMTVVDSMPSPLLEDLIIGRNILLANGTFREALEEMSEHTASKDLKFLCACMIQASISGSNMTIQIDNIQKVLESRRQVAAEIDKSVKAVAPALWLAGLVIPVMFGVSYFMDAAAADFWFTTLMGWMGFFGVLFLYGIGLIMTKNSVDKVRNI